MTAHCGSIQPNSSTKVHLSLSQKPRWYMMKQFWWCAAPGSTIRTPAACGNTPGTLRRAQWGGQSPGAICSSGLQDSNPPKSITVSVLSIKACSVTFRLKWVTENELNEPKSGRWHGHCTLRLHGAMFPDLTINSISIKNVSLIYS
jgi:hypothetical protein